MAISITYRFLQRLKFNTEKEPLSVLKCLPYLSTHEQTCTADKYIKIQEKLKDFCTPHVIRSTMVSRSC